MANEEQLAILKQGVDAWNKWNEKRLDEAALKGGNIIEADLSGANLADVNLYQADLSGAELQSFILDS